MEFETNNPSPDELARLQASAKRVTLEPVSMSVVPEPNTGAELNDKLSETAHQPNISTDQEDTATQYAQFKQSSPAEPVDHAHPKSKAVVGSTVVACLFAAAFIWMATQ